MYLHNQFERNPSAGIWTQANIKHILNKTTLAKFYTLNINHVKQIQLRPSTDLQDSVAYQNFTQMNNKLCK